MSANMTNMAAEAMNTFSTSSEQTLYARTVDEKSAGFAAFHVFARRVSDGASKVWNINVGFKRDTGNATVFGLEILGTLGTVGDLVALATVTVDIDASGSDIRVRVTGLASQAIDWGCNETGQNLYHLD